MRDATRSARRRRVGPPRIGFLVALAAAGVAWWLSGDPTPPSPTPVSAAPASPPAVVDTLHPSQTLSGVWSEHGLDPADLPAVVDAGGSLYSWRELRPGTVYRFTFAPDGSLDGLDLEIDRDRRLVLRRIEGAFRAALEETAFERRTRGVSACIDGSPWQTLSDAGEDPGLTVRMAEVLAAQVDFYTDLHPDDCFDLAVTVDQRPDGTYRVVSLDGVRLTLRSGVHEAYRYTPPGESQPEFYDADGMPLRRMFLRSPLKYVRVSSGFGVRRHPILHSSRMHYGVDYAAPVGTPVQAAGAGEVVEAGRHGGHGLYIKLRHGKHYFTSYSHLSRLASQIRRGAQVEQGQVIGFVGSTGLSTGPHLDYRFMKDGKYVDPLSTDLPTGVPLEGAELVAFRGARDDLRGRMVQAASLARAVPRDGLEVPAAGR